jgi:hypothetical protein
MSDAPEAETTEVEAQDAEKSADAEAAEAADEAKADDGE